jgi:hypothetical protein
VTGSEDKLRSVFRSHSRRIIENRKEIADLKAQVRRVRELLERCESRQVIMVPVSIIRDALDQCEVPE